jgi:hypothetical protein
MVQQQQQATALAYIESIESELLETLNLWREELKVRSPSVFQKSLNIRGFENPEPAPEGPDFEAARRACEDKAAAAVHREQPMRGWSRVAWTSGIPVAALMAMVWDQLSLFAGIATALVAQSIATNWWKRRLAPACRERADKEWIALESELHAQHRAAFEAFHQRASRAQEAWLEREKARVEAVRRLLRGDADMVHAATSAALEQLDFPFETECEILVDDEDHLMIDVDLPEIEDVIPETRYKALKDGTLKEAKRKVSERNQAYSELVCGIALAVAATALSAAPTLTHVTVAGRTQRPLRGGVGIDDAYVFETKLPRELFSKLPPQGLNSVETLAKLPTTRVQVLSNGSLKKISPPDWRR